MLQHVELQRADRAENRHRRTRARLGEQLHRPLLRELVEPLRETLAVEHLRHLDAREVLR